MAQVVVTLKIMPENPSVKLELIQEIASKKIAEFGGEVGKTEIEPVAFGLNALKLYFVMNEDIGSTEALENEIKTIRGVGSVEVIDVRRAIG